MKNLISPFYLRALKILTDNIKEMQKKPINKNNSFQIPPTSAFLANTPRNASVPQRNGEIILIFLIISGII